jgi:polyisoprenoid-binding protein YceI
MRRLTPSWRVIVSCSLRRHVTRRAVTAWAAATWLTIAAPVTPAPAVARFRFEPSKSTVRFDADATTHVVHGLSHEVSGEATFDPEDLSRAAAVKFRLASASLETGNKVRDRKMRETHLEAPRFPFIAFRSTKIAAITPTLRAGETQELSVEGTLSLHGVEHPVALVVKAARTGGVLRVTGETTLRLTDYAIPIPRFLFFRMKDEVRIMFEAVAVEVSAPQGPRS